MTKKILVIGGTGMLGEPVARHLLKDGFSVRIMTRNKFKAEKKFGNNFEIVAGDITNQPSIEHALDGCQGVHINLSHGIEHIGVEHIVQAARSKKIERISYISGSTVSEENAWFPQIRQKLRAERAILESAIPYCIFYPTWFMESLPKFVQGNKAVVFDKQPHPVHFVAADDYARMVAVSYKHYELANKRYVIHGPEPWLFHDALMKYCEVFHPEITSITTMPSWVAYTIAMATGRKEMKFASRLMHYFHDVSEKGNPSQTNELLGAPETGLTKWLLQKKRVEMAKIFWMAEPKRKYRIKY